MLHTPVFLKESIEGLITDPNGVYLDVTYGAGGHASEVIRRLGVNGRLIGFDQDKEALGNALDDPRFTLIHSNFRYIEKFADLYDLNGVHGLIADLGVSSMQIDSTARGFSFRFEAPLDMRMGVSGMCAADYLNQDSYDDLVHMFSAYGEIRNAKTLAAEIVRHRSVSDFSTVGQLVAVLDKLYRGQRNRYFAQVFQSLRIRVNDEMAALTELMQQAFALLRSGGRLVVLTYHSIEDRLVKHYMKSGNINGLMQKDDYGNIYRPFKLITKKPMVPGPSEVSENPRARSAKLRIAEKI
jgi:16S rRNA (cytosine1402-N4)-methyltransferase